jgi:hypothetical protein
VCYAGNKSTKIYVPPPADFLKKSSAKGGTIKVYYTGFSDQTITAFDYAIKILESILPAGTKTTVLANWAKIETTGVLGNSSVTAVVGGWSIDAYKPLALYPVSLAEKIAGTDLNPEQSGDIVLTLNSSSNWYLGTDGNVPAGKFDLVTVVLHELCHGLGFFDSMNADNTTGWYGISSFPVIYDMFIENSEGRKLTDTLIFPNNSPELLKQFTGGKLYFKGPVLKAMTGEEEARIYAPSTWDNGSSISHLDEEMSVDPESRLMTPFIDMQEAIHNPGIYTKAILGDLGWINTRILHNPEGDTEKTLTSLDLEVEIKSDTTYNRDKVGVVFSYDGFETRDTLFMSSPGADNIFKRSLNITSYNTEIQYYFFTEDIFKRIFISPSLFPVFRYKSFIGSDTVKPVISHTPADFYYASEDTLKLSAEVNDNLGVDTVYLEYRINNGLKHYAGFKNDSAHIYTLSMPAGSALWKGGDFLNYRIMAADSALYPNVTSSPDTGNYSVEIVGLNDVVSSYSTDFEVNTGDFYLSSFVIKRLLGWQKAGLHSNHPYISPETDATINSVALLRSPVKFDKSGMLIQYSDIALVEPGEPGALFGSEDFYDYVVVEGSKDFGKTWHSLFNGYDANYNSSWLKAYNSSIVNQNSTASAKESMLVQETEFIQPDNNFKAGDTLLIRFRLFSDPYANGWGWVIQDLKINPLVDAVEERYNGDMKVYPNPGNGIIRIDIPEGYLKSHNPHRYQIFSTSGSLVINGFLNQGTEDMIDISGHPPGFYIVVVYLDDGVRTFKYCYMK